MITKLHVAVDLLPELKAKNPDIDYHPIVSTQNKFIPVTAKSIQIGDTIALMVDDADAESFQVTRKGYNYFTDLEGNKTQSSAYHLKGKETHHDVQVSHPMGTVWKAI